MKKDEIKNYTQDDGLISPDISPSHDSTGNGILYLSLWHFCLFKNNMARHEDYLEYKKIISSCLVKNTSAHFQRSPTKLEEQISKDDYIGIIVISYLYNLRFHKDIYDVGNRYRYFPLKYVFEIPINKFNIKAWFQRFFDFVVLIKVSNYKTPNIVNRFFYNIKLFFDILSNLEDTSKIILFRLCDHVVRDNESVLMATLSCYLNYKIVKKWGSFKNVVAHHLGRGNIKLGLEHPIAKYWR